MIYLLPIRDAKSLPKVSSFNNANLQKILKEFGLHYPYTDGALLKTYSTKLTERGLLVRRKTMKNGHIRGPDGMANGVSDCSMA
ncbi:linear gramicidin synthase subunit d-like [Plakobranchus ocellatus]|uniref:Linear gramicidin synthase subunit d-like n=1 Tax=Plakobranchus ocellatus TaxID=259542 RepID=A0AAV3YRU4_9GAST|nr:linear gramicidin synthase subunit d-like [Plakobranchus ocellatus]